MDYTSWSLFEEPYWLDCVAPGKWDAVEIRNGKEIVGRLPYVVKKKLGVTSLSNPSLTPWLGPWIRPKAAKYTKVLSTQHKVLAELIDGLPKATRYEIVCAPEFTNAMAFHWAGFSLQLGYTYRISDVTDIDQIWSNFDGHTRNVFRKADGQLRVSREPDFDALCRCIEQTYSRQNMDAASLLGALERIEEVMAKRGQRTIYVALDGQDRVHAANYVVFDERHMFTLAGGGDPELRNSGADTLLTFEAIKDCVQTSKIFDCAGSMMRTVEPFVRGFGAIQTPKIIGAKAPAALNLASNILSRNQQK